MAAYGKNLMATDRLFRWAAFPISGEKSGPPWLQLRRMNVAVGMARRYNPGGKPKAFRRWRDRFAHAPAVASPMLDAPPRLGVECSRRAGCRRSARRKPTTGGAGSREHCGVCVTWVGPTEPKSCGYRVVEERQTVAKAEASPREATKPIAVPDRRESSRLKRVLPPGGRSRRLVFFEEIGVFGAVILLMVLIYAFHPNILSSGSLDAILIGTSSTALIAYGMVFLLSMRELDLSVGSIFGFCVVAPGILMSHGWNPWLAAVMALVFGAGLGALNGLLVGALSVPTIIVTLGTLNMYRGLVDTISHGTQVSNLPYNSSFFTFAGGSPLGVPLAFWVTVIVGVCCYIFFKRTRFGILCRAIGSNPRAARASGVPVAKVRLGALVLTGVLCGIAGALTLGYFQAADPTLGTSLELSVIAAAIIGGTSLAGGSGTIVGALLGAILLQVISSGLAEFQVSANWETFITGAIIVLAVALDLLVRRRKRVQAERAREADL